MLEYVEEPPKPTLVPGEEDREALSKGLWMSHDPAIFFDPVSENYYTYCTGAIARRSKDLIHWEYLGKVVEDVPKEAAEWTGSHDIWAPDIIKVGDEYRLYCSNSSWGVQQSCIFLAVCDCPEGPFVPRGIVLKTSEDLPVNGIDANPVVEEESGRHFMVYGSFWGGIYLLELDPETGLAKNKDEIGICLAKRPAWMSGAIEGPYIVYREGYYYLFVSYGSLKTDYNIRVGRSKKITGPYLDAKGCDLRWDYNEGNAGQQAGNPVFSGYAWNDGVAWMAPGHNSVLKDNWCLVCHIRQKNFTMKPELSTMQIRKLYWSTEGWPMISPEIYAGEELREYTAREIEGFYERITFEKSLPQGISTAVPMKFGADGYYECCSIQGQWHWMDGEKGNRMKITYGSYQEEAVVMPVYDRERGCETIGICGISEEGIAFMGKRHKGLA